MATRNTSAWPRTLAGCGSILLAATLFLGCGSHGGDAGHAGGPVASATDATEQAPVTPAAHRIRLPLAAPHVRHRHAGPR